MVTSLRLLALALVTALHLSCSVKQPCTVSLAQSPELRGFRLGMSLSDIQKRFPGFPPVSANRFGLAKVELSNLYVRNVLDRPVGNDMVSLVSAAPFPELKELKHVELKLLDGRLTEITVYYPNDIKWESADEFARKTGEVLKVNGSWSKVGKDNEYSEVRSMQCGGVMEGEGFRISAGFRRPTLENPGLEEGKLPYVNLEDFWGGEMKLFSRERESEEQTRRQEEERKQTFKP